jgi:hypothetical protein
MWRTRIGNHLDANPSRWKQRLATESCGRSDFHWLNRAGNTCSLSFERRQKHRFFPGGCGRSAEVCAAVGRMWQASRFVQAGSGIPVRTLRRIAPQASIRLTGGRLSRVRPTKLPDGERCRRLNPMWVHMDATDGLEKALDLFVPRADFVLHSVAKRVHSRLPGASGDSAMSTVAHALPSLKAHRFLWPAGSVGIQR